MTDLEMSASELSRLERRHSDIRIHGFGALAKQLEREALQERRQTFVVRFGIGCLRCGTKFGEWVAGGKSARGPWVICSRCIREPRKAKEA